MFDKRRNGRSNRAGSSDIFGTRRKASDKVLATIVRNNNVEEGMSAFTLWLGENENPASMSITLKQFTRGINKVVVSLQDISCKKTLS